MGPEYFPALHVGGLVNNLGILSLLFFVLKVCRSLNVVNLCVEQGVLSLGWV